MSCVAMNGGLDRWKKNEVSFCDVYPQLKVAPRVLEPWAESVAVMKLKSRECL